MKRYYNPLWMVVTADIHALEYDSQTQYKFHRFWAFFWFATMLGVLFIPAMLHNIASLLIMEASLWANFATHFGAMSSALAVRPARAELTDKVSEVING